MYGRYSHIFQLICTQLKLTFLKSEWDFPQSLMQLSQKGSQVMISKNIVFLSMKIDFFLAYSVVPDEMLHDHCGTSYHYGNLGLVTYFGVKVTFSSCSIFFI